MPTCPGWMYVIVVLRRSRSTTAPATIGMAARTIGALPPPAWRSWESPSRTTLTIYSLLEALGTDSVAAREQDHVGGVVRSVYRADAVGGRLDQAPVPGLPHTQSDRRESQHNEYRENRRRRQQHDEQRALHENLGHTCTIGVVPRRGFGASAGRSPRAVCSEPARPARRRCA